MRVIAGIYGSRILTAPKGDSTRPTSDRLRETLFNILAPKIDGCRFLDLYAGTGAVGIEALSRGAGQVWFAEDAPAALRALRGNLAALKIGSGFAVEEKGVGSLLERLAKTATAVDVVFLDPPYEAEGAYVETLNFLGGVRGAAVLAEGAVVVAEHGSKAAMAERFGRLQRYRQMRQGDAALSFYRVAARIEA